MKLELHIAYSWEIGFSAVDSIDVAVTY